ncbi:MAG: hypothetical protein ACE141_19020 [Bryobacteraceae bacterium]
MPKTRASPVAKASPWPIHRMNASTAEWLADLQCTFEAVVLALAGGLSSTHILPEHDAGRLGLLLTRGEWKAVVEAAERYTRGATALPAAREARDPSPRARPSIGRP